MTLRMCSVTRAPSTKPFQNSSASCGSNVPIHSATGSTSYTRNGRPERSSATCTSASSSGTSEFAKRRTPRLSPSASRERLAEHDADVFDGVVQIDVEVALGLDRADRSPRACRAARACGRRTGCRWRSTSCRFRRPRASRSIVVSLVSRRSCGGAAHGFGHWTTSGRTAFIAARNASFSAGVPDRDAQAAFDPGPRREVAHEHAALEQALPQVVRVAVDPHEQEVRTRRHHRESGQVGERGEQPAALLHERRDPLLHLAAEVERDRARDLRRHRKRVRQQHLLELGDHPRRARPRSRGEPRPATTPSSTCARPRAAGRRRRARARSTARTRRRPRRPRATRRSRSRPRAVARRWRAARRCRSGCWGCTRTPPTGASRASAPRPRRDVDREVARRAHRPRSRSRCSRAICACSAYVGSKISARRPVPP